MRSVCISTTTFSYSELWRRPQFMYTYWSCYVINVISKNTILKVKHLKGKVLFTHVRRICSDNSQDGFFLLKKVDRKTKSWKDIVWIVAGEKVRITGQKVCQTLNLFDRGYSKVYTEVWEAGKWKWQRKSRTKWNYRVANVSQVNLGME